MELIGIEQLAKQYGPFVALIAFSMLTGWWREKRCEGRLKALETTIYGSLIKTVKRNTTVLTTATGLLQRLETFLPKTLRRNRKPIKRTSTAPRRRAA